MTLAGQILFVSDQRKLFGDFYNTSSGFSPAAVIVVVEILRKVPERVDKIVWEYFSMVRRALANIYFS